MGLRQALPHAGICCASSRPVGAAGWVREQDGLRSWVALWELCLRLCLLAGEAREEEARKLRTSEWVLWLSTRACADIYV